MKVSLYLTRKIIVLTNWTQASVLNQKDKAKYQVISITHYELVFGVSRSWVQHNTKHVCENSWLMCPKIIVYLIPKLLTARVLRGQSHGWKAQAQYKWIIFCTAQTSYLHTTPWKILLLKYPLGPSFYGSRFFRILTYHIISFNHTKKSYHMSSLYFGPEAFSN